MDHKILVTGGCGYIGAHCVRGLVEKGFAVQVVDNLSAGWEAATVGDTVRGDIRDRDMLRELFQQRFDAVLHMAALSDIPSCTRDPLTCFDVNVSGTQNVVNCAAEAGNIPIVFSSSCSIYGPPQFLPLDETHLRNPKSVYGESKHLGERILEHAETQHGLVSIRLRYFNAAGASTDSWIGEAHTPETHVIPLALRAAAKGKPFHVFGHHWSTPDGSAVRDFVHVEDLASAHVLAIEAVINGHAGGSYNIGTGTGTSVLELVQMVQEVTGSSLDVRLGPPREGDPEALIADSKRFSTEFGWTPRLNLREMVESAWEWGKKPRYGPSLLD